MAPIDAADTPKGGSIQEGWRSHGMFSTMPPMKPNYPREISEKQWVTRATARIKLYVPTLHDNDAEKLAEDLQRSWPAMAPEAAVNFFFRPHTPQGESPASS